MLEKISDAPLSQSEPAMMKHSYVILLPEIPRHTKTAIGPFDTPDAAHAYVTASQTDRQTEIITLLRPLDDP